MDFSDYGQPSKQWLDFIAKNPGAANDGLEGNNIHEVLTLQQTANEARAVAGASLLVQSGLKEHVEISTISIPSNSGHSIPIRRYAPRHCPDRKRNSRGLLYFHGGGFLFGSETSDDFFCAETAQQIGITVLSVIYRHTPQHKHPAAHDDALEAFHYVTERPGEFEISLDHGLVALGVSAGASLAAYIVSSDLEQTRVEPSRKPLVTGVVLSIPWLIHIENYPIDLFASPDKSSSVQCRDQPIVPWPRLKLFSDLLDAADVKEPRLNAALRSDDELNKWPKTGFLIAGMDPLRDDGLLFARRLASLGTPVNVNVYPGVPHGFRRWPELPFAKQSDMKTQELISQLMELDATAPGFQSGWNERS